MTITFLHTADWQLGKSFGSIEGDTAALLREERFEAVKRIALLATERDVELVLDGALCCSVVLPPCCDKRLAPCVVGGGRQFAGAAGCVGSASTTETGGARGGVGP